MAVASRRHHTKRCLHLLLKWQPLLASSIASMPVPAFVCGRICVVCCVDDRIILVSPCLNRRFVRVQHRCTLLVRHSWRQQRQSRFCRTCFQEAFRRADDQIQLLEKEASLLCCCLRGLCCARHFLIVEMPSRTFSTERRHSGQEVHEDRGL